jgi:hypothetical protein
VQRRQRHGLLCGGARFLRSCRSYWYRRIRNSTQVAYRLTVVLRLRLQFRYLEQPVRGGVEQRPSRGRRHAPRDPLFQRGVVDRHRSAADQTGVSKATLTGQAEKVVPVQCAGQALSPQNRVLTELLGYTLGAVYIAEIQLAPYIDNKKESAWRPLT